MTRNPRRIQLTPGYILHHRPYRDTSRILEVSVVQMQLASVHQDRTEATVVLIQ